MPSTYHLQPDEWVISKSGMGAYHGPSPTVGLRKTELVLTSRNILVVSLSIQDS